MERHGCSRIESNAIYDPVKAAIGHTSDNSKRWTKLIENEDCSRQKVQERTCVTCLTLPAILPSLPPATVFQTHQPALITPLIGIGRPKTPDVYGEIGQYKSPSPSDLCERGNIVPLPLSNIPPAGLNKINVISAAPTAKSFIPAIQDRDLLSMIPANVRIRCEQLIRVENKFMGISILAFAQTMAGPRQQQKVLCQDLTDLNDFIKQVDALGSD